MEAVLNHKSVKVEPRVVIHNRMSRYHAGFIIIFIIIIMTGAVNSIGFSTAILYYGEASTWLGSNNPCKAC